MKRFGKYELISEIGRGGFGSVYTALDPSVDRKVAIKVLTAGNDADVMARFRNEAVAAGKLNHVNIVTLYDFGEQDGVPYIVMELLEGRDLHQTMARKIPLTLDQKLSIISQTAAGLHHAHINGFAHRDVKPGNIMVLPDFTVKILDFGIARLMQSTQARLTQKGSIVGTMTYIAPELLRGADSDAITDIFSLGVVAYELLTGVHPFHANDAAAVMFAIMSRNPEPVRSLVPDCPPAVEEIIMRAMAKDREERYHSALDMMLDIEPILRDLRRNRAESLIAEAREKVEADALDTAASLVRESLELDPASRSARQLRDTVNQKLRRRSLKPRIDVLLSEGRDLLANRDFAGAQARFEAGLRLDSTDRELDAALKEVQTAQARAMRADSLVADARRAFQEINLTGAYQNVVAALEEDRNHPQAAALLEQIRLDIERRQKEREIQDALARVQSLLVRDALDDALAQIQNIEQRNPAAPGLADLKTEVLRRKAERERHEYLVRSLQHARNLLAERKFPEAIAAAERLADEFPNTAEVNDLLAGARRAYEVEQQSRALAEASQNVERALASGDVAGAMQVLDAVSRLVPPSGPLSRLQQRVLAAKAAADRLQAIQEVLAKAKALLERQQPADALQTLDAALREYGSDAALVEWRARAEAAREGQRREQARRAVLDQARTLLQRQSAAEAIRVLQQAVMAHPGDTELDGLLKSAQSMLETQQRAERLDRAVRELNAFLTAGYLEQAQVRLQEALQQFPGEQALTALASQLADAQARRSREQAIHSVRDAAQRLADSGKAKEALSLLDEVLARDSAPELAEARWEIEQRYQEQRQRALEQARQKIERNLFDDALLLIRPYQDASEVAALIAAAEEGKRKAALQAEIDRILERSSLLANSSLDQALEAVESGRAKLGDDPRLLRMRDSLEERIRAEAARREEEARRKKEEEQRRKEEEQRRIEAERKRQEEERQRREEAERKRKEEHARLVEQTLTRANGLREKRAYAEALAAVNETLQSVGDQPRLTSLRSTLLEDQRRVQMAEAALASARALLDQGKPEEALRAVDRLEQTYPNDVDTRPLRQDIARAVEEQRIRAEIADAVRQAQSLASQHKFEAAFGTLEAALGRYPDHASLRACQQQISRDQQAYEHEQAIAQALAQLQTLTTQAAQAADPTALDRTASEAQRIASLHPNHKGVEKAAKAVAKAVSARRSALKKTGSTSMTAPQTQHTGPATHTTAPYPAAAPAPAPVQPGAASNTRMLIVVGAAVVVLGIAFAAWKFTRPATSRLEIASTPPGASVTVGDATCTTPDCALDLAPGTYKVAVSRPGYRPVETRVQIAAGKPASLPVNLEALPARLLVGTNFTAGTVTLDGRAAGSLRNGEFLLDSVANGTHQLAIKSPDGSATLRFSIAEGQPPKILDLPKVTDAQAVVIGGYASQPEAVCDCQSGEIKVDGAPAGQLQSGRATLSALSPGPHEISATSGDGQRTAVVAITNDPFLDLFLSADRNVGTIVVETGQDDVQIYLDNQRQNVSTKQGLARLTVPAKRYNIRVEKNGYDSPGAQAVDVKKGGMQRLSFALRASPATLAIQNATPGARVRIDGQDAGLVASDGSLRTTVPPGNHTIEFSRDGYNARRVTRDFSAGAQVSLGRSDAELARIETPPPPPPPVVKPQVEQPQNTEAQDWERVRNSRNIAQLEDYRRKYPNSPNSEQAARVIEQIEWEALANNRDPAAFDAFVRKYPNGQFTGQARRRAEELDWDSVNKRDAAAIRAYLQRHPNGAFSATAQGELANLQAADRVAADRQAVLDVLNRYQQAYASKNADAVTAVWPSLTGSSLQTIRQVFRTARTINLELKPTQDPVISGDSATVMVQRTLRQTFDRQPLVNQDVVTIRLNRSGRGWVIQSIN